MPSPVNARMIFNGWIKRSRDVDREKEGRSPWGALDMALLALETARPDTKEGGAVRRMVDDAVHYLRKAGARYP